MARLISILSCMLILSGCESRTPSNATASASGSVREAAQQMAKSASYLFVQEGTRGAFRPARDSSPAAIVLWGGKGLTTWFTDRPARDAGVMPTSLLFAEWARGNDSFKADPPNAALVISEPAGESQVYAMEVLTPAYEPLSNAVAYEVRPLSEGWPAANGKKTARPLSEIPARFGNAVLFIDPSEGWCLFAYGESCESALCDPLIPFAFNKAKCNAERNPPQPPQPPPPPVTPQCTDGQLASGAPGNWTCSPPATVLNCGVGRDPYPIRLQPPYWVCESDFVRTAPLPFGAKGKTAPPQGRR
ncbi:MAG: hypothetical protein M3Z17_09375 [Gemmatimonadota bacterium]|nr:hypothetical protein [Gemmatimonadota bacterium]